MQLCIRGGEKEREEEEEEKGESEGRLAVLGRGKKSKCIAEGEEEEGLQLLFMSSCEQRAHLGPYVNPQQAPAH